MPDQILHLYKFGLVVIEDNRLLLCEPYAFEDLILPGGIKEGSETYFQNLTREVREELGEDAVLDENSLLYLGRFEDIAAGRTERFVEIDLYLGKILGILQASSEIKALHWFSPLDDANRLSPIIKNQILPFLIQNGLLVTTTSVQNAGDQM
jgi:8-oxo-dGTP pyrophosphatase MutT (NUDIX family)